MENTFKNDKKSVRTRERIKLAYSVLTKNKPVYEISVTELTNLAKVSRNTFYTQYNSVIDVIYDISNDILSGFEDLLCKYDYYEFVENPYPLMRELTIECNKNSAFLKYVVFNKESSFIVQKLCDEMTERFYTVYQLEHTDENEVVPYLMEFIVSGVIQIIYKWHKDGKKVEFEKILKNISELIKNNVEIIRKLKREMFN